MLADPPTNAWQPSVNQLKKHPDKTPRTPKMQQVQGMLTLVLRRKMNHQDVRRRLVWRDPHAQLRLIVCPFFDLEVYACLPVQMQREVIKQARTAAEVGQLIAYAITVIDISSQSLSYPISTLSLYLRSLA
jgi:hypothetical protein